MTRKLYYEDEYLSEFDAQVLTCEPQNGKWQVTLNQTAFFPEGGGQWPDLGHLGNVNVLDVQEQGDEVLHFTDGPLVPGDAVHGSIDWERRFSVMQQHSGEHIFSGLVHAHYGYDNVGFHIGTDAETMDFNGMLTMEQALEIEQEVNQFIYKNIPIEHLILVGEEKETIEYRSKKPIEGELRIIRIPGADTCACCGTHVKMTGAIGQVKVLGVQKYKSGVRVSILCGKRALEYEDRVFEEMERIRILLSSKGENAAGIVEHLLEDRRQLRYEREQMAMQLFEMQMEKEKTQAIRVIVCPALSPESTAKAAGKLAAGATVALVISGTEEPHPFAMGMEAGNARELTKQMCAAFNGKGGGKPEMTQGKIACADEAALRSWLTSAIEQSK